MKKLLSYFLALAVFGSCNNSKSPEATGSAATETSSAAKSTNDISGDCSSLAWFKKGTVMQYSMTSGVGKDMGTTTTTINDVRKDGTATIADYTTTWGEGKTINASYKCENGRIYMNMKSLFSDIMAGMKRPGIEVEVTDAYLAFPGNMKPGDNLEGGVFELKMKQEGKDFMIMRSEIKDRKVESIEKITTPAGSWDCMKLVETRSISTEMMGRKMPAQEIKSVQWFTPVAGLVKFASYDANGKVTFETELVSIK
jgi:hypothetical protein